MPFAVTFVASGLITATLAVYRKWGLAMREDDYIHISEGEGRYIPQQVAVNHRIHTVDVVGKALTVFTGAAGVALFVAWVYEALSHY